MNRAEMTTDLENIKKVLSEQYGWKIVDMIRPKLKSISKQGMTSASRVLSRI